MPRSIEELADRQIRRWVESRRSAQAVPPRPCIAISRQPGSGAAELGQRAAEELRYAFFGVEIVDWIAQRTGYRRQLIAGVDERIRSAIERSVSDNLHRTPFSETDYFQYVVRTVASFSERGGAVMLGRGSPFIVDPERALRVLVVAERSVRLERLAKRHSLTPSEANARLDTEDQKRRDFLAHHFHRDPDDPSHYDLTLNLGTLSMEVATDTLVGTLRARFPSKRSSTGEGRNAKGG